MGERKVWQNLRACVCVNVLSMIDNQDVNRYITRINLNPHDRCAPVPLQSRFFNVNLKIKSLIEFPQESRFDLQTCFIL